MRLPKTLLFGGAAAALAAALFALPAPTDAQDAPVSWQAVKAEVPVGKSVRLELKLAGADGRAVAQGVTVTSTRLDMGPDGMKTMTAPLRPVASPSPGVVAFDTDLVMAGRWALTISANVAGQPKPVSGVVVFTAVEKRSEAAPAPASGAPRKALYYRNPMGLPDVSPVPKKDPMGMDYIAVYEDEASGPPGTVRISLDKVQRAGVRTEAVARRALSRTVSAVGTIVPDESRVAVVTAKFSGFVEELYVATTGAEVRAGMPLMRIWIESQDLLRKQSDYLVALRASPPRPSDVERAAQTLRLFGIPGAAIDNLARAGEPVRSLVVTAPRTGTVLEKPALAGMRFDPGSVLFRTADLTTVWVTAEVAERDLGAVRPGQTARVTLKAYPDAAATGTVAFVYPELNMATRTAPVRIELPNRDGLLKAGLYADVEIAAEVGNGPVIAVPNSAIIDSGRRRVAFVAKDDGMFEPRDLALGRRGDGFVEVREGLAEGERIVVAGNFLIDAESNLRAALAAFTRSNGAGPAE
jgi:Cu(I)/Ag(I) efflux system membrane fusion protein